MCGGVSATTSKKFERVVFSPRLWGCFRGVKMGFFNSVILIGRLVKQAELKISKSGSAIVNFTVGVSELQKAEPGEFVTRSNFFDVTAFGKYPQACMQSLTKGREVAIKGRLKQERWEKDGKHYSKIAIYADDLQILREPKGLGTVEEPPSMGFEPQIMEEQVLQNPVF